MRALLVPVLWLAAFAGVAATNQLRPWTDYRTILWIGESARKQPEKFPLFLQRLRDMGINTGMVYGDSSPQPFVDHRFPYYVENVINKGLCLKWSSNVRDWDKFVTTWTKTGRSESAFVRDYCLDDPQWRSWARAETQRVVRRNAPHEPLAYDIRDELSTTISANPFDYDFNPITLAKFRDWLKTQYQDLAALNAQWETQFKSWADVKPFTTDQIKNRMASGDALPRGQPDWQAVQRIQFDPVEARKQPTRWNFSPWCDFRTYMDLSLAGALDDLRQAARALDPRTPVGIEGTQMPHAFGGYDLWRLSQVLDWVEPYDIGNAREIFGSFMPGKPILTTVFEKDTNHARRRLWHLLLEGDRGCIVWWSEDCIDWKSQDYALTPKGKALTPVLKEMTSPLAQVFMRAEKEYDPIAILYSQASIQVDWLIESTRDGSTWHRRFSSFEADHNRMARVRNAWLKALQDLGCSPRFVSSAEVESGELLNSAPGFRACVLPTAFALSDKEFAALDAFLERTGTANRVVLHDGACGSFDQHGRLRLQASFRGVVAEAPSSQRSFARGTGGKTVEQAGDIAAYAKDRLQEKAPSDWLDWIASHMRLKLPVELHAPNPRSGIWNRAFPRIRIHRYHLGRARLLAFERNIDYHMSEDLKQAGGNEALEKPINADARLAQPGHLYDLAAPEYLGFTDHIPLHVDPWRPSLFALLPEKVPAESVVASLLAQAK